MSIRSRLAPCAQAVSVSEHLESRVLLAATALVKDIQDVPTTGMAQGEHVPVGTGAVVLFRAADPAGGHELWRSDGTDAGTFRLMDINPGPDSSGPSNLANVNGVVYFSAHDGATGAEMWRSDGTRAGTFRLGDLRPGPAGSFPQEFTKVNDKIYFSADDGAPGLWTSDGTAAGTRRVKQFTDAGASRPSEFRWFNGALLFRGADAINGLELWRSDGTAAGTTLLKDIFPGAGSSFPHGIRTVGSTIVLGANDGVNGYELWTTDGTSANTKRITQLAPGGESLFLHSPVEVNGVLYFGGSQNGSYWHLYRTDGTAAGSRLVKEFPFPDGINNASRIVAHNGLVYFQSAHTGDLWRSDGTGTGTYAVSDLSPFYVGSGPGGFILPMGNRVYFTAGYGGDSAGSLFASDGTALVDPGVIDPATGRHPEAVSGGAIAGGRLFVAAKQKTGADGSIVDDRVRVLWRSDGTSPGTSVTADVGSGTLGSGTSGSFRFASAGDKLFFTPNHWAGVDNFWVSDGTAAGTVKLPADVGQLADAVGSGGVLYFNNYSNGFMRSDGTVAGTVYMPASARAKFDFNGRLLFSGLAPGGAGGFELWTSDGTDAGTRLLKDILPGSASSDPSGFAVMKGLAYFSTSDGGTTGGRHLWRTDGTPVGTVQLPGIPHNPTNLVAAGDRLFWTNGVTLYVTDGTAAGTVALRTFASGGPPYAVDQLVNLKGTLLFRGGDADGYELWRSDGTVAGTVPVTAAPGGNGLETYGPPITVAGNYAYFMGGSAMGVIGAGELWVTDGTRGGTRLLKDIYGDGWWSNPTALTALGDGLYFRAANEQVGHELWQTDGTPAGTMLVQDILPGPASSYVEPMHVAGNTLFLAADDGIHGHELRKLVPPPPGAQPVTLRAAADAYVRDGTSAAANFGTATELVVKKASTAGSNRESYLRFDLSSVPSVGAAKLRLFGRLGDTTTASIVTTVYSADNTTWSETGLTWNTKPAAGATSHGTVTVSGTTGKWYELDLTTFLAAEKAAGRDLVTLVLKNGTATSAQTIFASDETAANRPELVVTPAGPPPQGLVVSAGNVAVPEGKSASFTVKLAVQPAGDVVVSVAKGDGGDGDLSVATTSLTFTAANWNVAQTVTLNAAEDTDTTNGTASFAVSSDGLATKTVAATEADNDAPPPAATRRATRDAYVRGGSTYGNTNFGSSTELAVRKAATTGSTRETYLHFAISDLVAADLDTVKLRLFGRSSSSTQAVPVAVFGGGTASWTESGITYNNRPASEAAVLASGTVGGTTNAWREFDVTAYVKARREAGATGVTFVIKGTSTTDAQATFASDEHATSTSRPQLAVTVKPAGPPPQEILVSATNVVVEEGGSSGFTVKLAAQPTADVTVTLAKASGGDADLSTTVTTLTFTSANWDVGQTVTVDAAQDADTTNGTASFTVSSSGLTTKTVTATESDDDAPAAPVTLRAAADAYVRDGTSSATNFGAAADLVVKRASTAGSNRESYLRFDLSTAPSTIASAKLRLFGRLGDTTSATLQTQVFSATDTTWTESGLTWDTRPAAGATALGTITVAGTTAAWYELDLTAFLAAERAAGRTQVTLVLRNPTASSAQTIFTSDEAATGRPELVVE